MPEYAFDNADTDTVPGRFSALEICYDPVTTANLARLGVRPGMRCLEVGGGGGSIARWLGERVGPGGHVLVTDIDPRWTRIGPDGRGAPAGNIEVITHDVAHDVLPEATFDLVHARLVLIHLPDRLAALDRLVRALKPGGTLVVDEFAVHDIAVLRSPSPADTALFHRVHEAMLDVVVSAGASRTWYRDAYAAFVSAGLTGVDAIGHTQTWPAGSPGCDLHRVNVAQLRDKIIASGVGEDEVGRFYALLDDPGFAVSSYPLVMTSGRRPGY